jgi:hypothetical protein
MTETEEQEAIDAAIKPLLASPPFKGRRWPN